MLIIVFNISIWIFCLHNFGVSISFLVISCKIQFMIFSILFVFVNQIFYIYFFISFIKSVNSNMCLDISMCFIYSNLCLDISICFIYSNLCLDISNYFLDILVYVRYFCCNLSMHHDSSP